MIETWKDIEGYEGLYQVSDWGRVKSLAREKHIRADRVMITKEIILKSRITNAGYEGIILQSDGKAKHFLMHRLVANAFIENTCNKRFVNHKDGIKTNNSIYNLEWVTKSENEKHAFRTGLKKTFRPIKYSKETVEEILKLLDSKEISHEKIGKKMGISRGYITYINSMPRHEALKFRS